MIDAFNRASALDREMSRDKDQLRESLIQISNSWDMAEAQHSARRELRFQQIVAARTHGLRLCPISALRTSILDYIPDLTLEARARLIATISYREAHNGQWPDYYRDNQFLQKLDRHMIELGTCRLLNENFRLDYDRAMILQGLAAPDKRVGVLYGDAHFRGPQETGIDSHLPQNQLVYVRIAASALPAPSPDIPRRSPDFILDSSTRQAFVMQTAVDRGLWPKPPSP